MLSDHTEANSNQLRTFIAKLETYVKIIKDLPTIFLASLCGDRLVQAVSALQGEGYTMAKPSLHLPRHYRISEDISKKVRGLEGRELNWGEVSDGAGR